MKLDFLGVGMQKSGTSTLHDILDGHPDVFVPKGKELHFFDENWERGVEWYEDKFSSATGADCRGEVTPDYMAYPWIAGRIVETLGRAPKILILLRDPAVRAYSQFNHHRRFGIEPVRRFEDVLEAERKQLVIDRRETWCKPAYYLAKGMYSSMVAQYHEHFGRDRCKVFIFEEFISDPIAARTELSEFLEIPEFPAPTMVHSNKSTLARSEKLWQLAVKEPVLKKAVKKVLGPRKYQSLHHHLTSVLRAAPGGLSDALRADLLQNVFRDDIRRLEELLDRPLDLWRGGI